MREWSLARSRYISGVGKNNSFFVLYGEKKSLKTY